MAVETETMVGERFLSHLLFLDKNSMKIKFHGLDERGRVTFSFPLTDISDDELRKDLVASPSLRQEFGTFLCDAVGETVVRRNLACFFDFFMGLSDKEYNDKVLAYDHLHWGIGCNGRSVSMIFHSSLLYEIFVGMVSHIASGGQ